MSDQRTQPLEHYRGPTLEQAGGPIHRPKCSICATNGVVRTATRVRFDFGAGFRQPRLYYPVCGLHRG